jgi:hypothetical protein
MPQNLAAFRDSVAASLDAGLLLAASMEDYLAPEAGSAPPDGPAFTLSSAFASALSEMQSSALPATSDMLQASKSSLDKSLALFGDVAPRVAARKTALLEFDSYKRKVETLRAAPPKNDPEKLPRNEEKLTKACADLATANDELISNLVKLERAKAAMLAGELRNIVDATYLFFQQAEVRLEGVMAIAAKKPAEKTPAAKPKPVEAPPRTGENEFGVEEPPIMEFHAKTSLKDEGPIQHPAPREDEEDPFGAAPPPPPPPPPSPAPAAAAAADDADGFNPFESSAPTPSKVLGVDDFDAFV